MEKKWTRTFLGMLLALTLVSPCAALPAAAADAGEAVPVTMFYVSPHSENVDGDVIKAYIKENFGIDLIVTHSYDSWQQKYSLMLSSGTIPDLSIMPIANYMEYAEEGAFYDITDVVGDYPGILEYVGDYWPRLTYGGRVYGLPNLNVPGKYNFVYRKDWLDKLGMSAPTTQDELVEMLRAFTEDDPDGNGVKDTYGYAAYNTGSSIGGMEMIYGMFGGAPNFYTDNDGVVDIGNISEGYKNALMFVKELVDKGYYDPESFTQKSDQYWQKFLRGQFGAFTGWWGDYAFPYLAYDMTETQPDAELALGDPIIGKDGHQGMIAYDPLAVVCAIGVNTKALDAIMPFIEWAMSDEGYRTLKYGTKGLYYDTDEEGNLTYYWQFNDNKRMDGVAVENVTEIYSIFQRLDIYKEQLGGGVKSLDMSLEAFIKSSQNPLLDNSFMGITTDLYTEMMPDISKYVDEMRMKFITGSESFDNWDSYIREYKRLGGIEVAESLLEKYNEMYDKDSVLKEY
ncbi:MAG: extracellular solute-binding protein [Oscillospiraceae bacterium]|jgi:ABC-type glycerol-3-phosphate transport system substrate-binding protein|nr:extracellular solute-binding protein [Oscillospiraceae bacterium]